MAGFVDVYRMMRGWWSATALPAPGVLRIAATQVYVHGMDEAEVYQSGASVGEVYLHGATATQVEPV